MAKQSSPGKKRSLLYISAGLLVFSLTLLFLIPTLLSTGWMKATITSNINQRIPGQLSFANLTIGWFNGATIQAISYQNKEAGIELKVPQLTTSKGLLSLAGNYRDFGKIILKNPLASVAVRQQPPIAKNGDQPAAKEQEPGETAQQEGAGQPAAVPDTSSNPASSSGYTHDRRGFRGCCF
jgi:hypothetical protein